MLSVFERRPVNNIKLTTATRTIRQRIKFIHKFLRLTLGVKSMMLLRLFILSKIKVNIAIVLVQVISLATGFEIT